VQSRARLTQSVLSAVSEYRATRGEAGKELLRMRRLLNELRAQSAALTAVRSVDDLERAHNKVLEAQHNALNKTGPAADPAALPPHLRHKSVYFDLSKLSHRKRNVCIHSLVARCRPPSAARSVALLPLSVCGALFCSD
jgi:hypothetical protein